MVHLSVEIKKKIIQDYYDLNLKPSQLAKRNNTSRTNIYKIINAKNLERKKYDTTNRWKLKEQEKIDIVNLIKNDPFIKPREIKAEVSMIEASEKTIRRHLKREGLNSYVALKKTKIDKKEASDRLRFAAKMSSWLLEKYGQLFLSDERTIENKPKKKFGKCMHFSFLM